MGKKRVGGRNADRDMEQPNLKEEKDAHKGLSKEAWVAIGAIAAALITGVVTLMTHILPQAPRSSSPPPASSTPPLSSTPRSDPSPLALPATADSIAGKWAGLAKDSQGTSFQITLEIRKSCAISERCGTISVSHVPCYGEVFLERHRTRSLNFASQIFMDRVTEPCASQARANSFDLEPMAS